MRWIRRWNETDSGCPALVGRRAPSFSAGLWQITHSSVVRRWPPWRARRSWQTLHWLIATDCRRGVIVPVMATLLTGLMAASRIVVAEPIGVAQIETFGLPSLRTSVTVRVMSAVTVQVPLASAGTAFVKV